ncbi:hypothetical protein ZWY2020_024771 [Hordeum vulgare]|nr:hypothetical protein ZWY2020_024771 [Hordeum vulgare]
MFPSGDPLCPRPAGAPPQDPATAVPPRFVSPRRPRAPLPATPHPTIQPCETASRRRASDVAGLHAMRLPRLCAKGPTKTPRTSFPSPPHRSAGPKICAGVMASSAGQPSRTYNQLRLLPRLHA